MNNYLITFDMYISKSNNKLKIDYHFFPVEKDGENFKSLVSDETLKNFKSKRKYYLKKFIQKDRVKISFIIPSELEFEEAEKKLIVFAMKKTFGYIPFRFSYKKMLKERVSRIMS